MENIKNFFKTKRVGYYIAIVDVILAAVLTIVFFATYGTAMANNASAYVPESIGIFMIAGLVIELIALALPEYLIIHAGALVFYCLAMMKEVYLIPNLIADEINNVHYQGGNLGMNLFYIIMIFVIIISAIVALFLGFQKKEDKEEMAVVEGGKPKTGKIIRLGSGLVVGVAAILVSVLVVNNMQTNLNRNTTDPEEPVTKVDPAERFKEAAEEAKKTYTFDPTSVHFSEGWYEQAPSTINSSVVGTGDSHGDHHLVYKFEGSYAEGWQGDYSLTYASLYLWDDGFFGGTSGNTQLRGYWYDRSSDWTEESGKPSDCLNMICSDNSSVICESTTGYYNYLADLTSSVNGGRRMKVFGYLYYPVIGLFIDSADSSLEYEFEAKFDRSMWTANGVLMNLKYSPIFRADQVKWTDPNTSVSGKQLVKASWGGFEDSVEITVKPDTSTYTFDDSGLVKKNYRLVDRFDPTGIVVKRLKNDVETEIDVKALPVEYDVSGNKVNITLPNAEVKSVAVTFDTSAAANTITGTIGGEAATFVLTAIDEMKATIGGEEVIVKIALSGAAGKLASIKIVEKKSGSDTAFAALGKSYSIEEDAGALIIATTRWYYSNDKMNNSSSQDGGTYFAITNDEFLTAFWHWVYNGGDECFIFKCTYTLNETAMTIVLNECLEDPRNEWQWCRSNDRSHAYPISEVSYDDIPENLTSRLTLYE